MVLSNLSNDDALGADFLNSAPKKNVLVQLNSGLPEFLSPIIQTAAKNNQIWKKK